MIVALRLIGILLLMLAAAHVPFARHFRWREEAAKLSPFNRQVLLVHAFFIGLVLAMIGTLVLIWPHALLTPNALGAPITGGLTLFFVVRLYVQWFVYERSLWQGKRFETAMHLLFSVFWLVLVVVFGGCWHRQLIG
jgi:hypothetical protein